MRSELVIKTRSLAGSSDLTLLAPIKAGLIPSLESMTYKSRVKRLLKTLNMGRSSSHEYGLIRPFSDAVERVGRINSVRVAVLEPEDKVLLAVTFDGAWESYIRVLWQKVGALLDVIFCNTEDYVSAYDHSFEAWVEWANRVQVETAFFYGMPVTVDDVRYLKNQESLHREKPAAPETDLQATGQSLRRVESLAWEVTAKGHFKVYPETAKLGLQSLSALYRLTDLYLPASADGKFLQRAARELLQEFVYLIETTELLDKSLEPVRERFEKQLAWLKPKDSGSVPHGQQPPKLPTSMPEYEAADVQGGILKTYDKVTHGCLLLIAFDGPAAASECLDRLIPQVTRSDADLKGGELVCNIAFTYEGLRAAGMSEAQLAYFPQEFREGMESRASVLGDFRLNHPRRWRLPVRNWPQVPAADAAPIELTAVHAVVQLRIGAAGDPQIDEVSDPAHPLHKAVKKFFPPESIGARILAVQAMRRYTRAGESIEHFGFVDGIGQPVIDPAQAGQIYSNQVQLGELLLGYDNEADPAPKAAGASCPFAKSDRLPWLHNGSFLVVRKLRQDVEALEQVIRKAMAADSSLQRPDILAKMMGRTVEGESLVPGRDKKNDFNYRFDPNGSACPFQAHIRRANPRSVDPQDVPEPPGRRTPRLMRRGMSYGPTYTSKPSEERGLIFMAYNASITEQYEVVQRWLNGGNSTGTFSGQSDPFTGVAENAQPRYFRFEHQGKVVRMALDGWDALLEEPKPLVRLEWGAYLFTPSMKALRKLQQLGEKGACPHPPAWSSADGLRRITAMEALEAEQGRKAARVAWKSALEDPEAIEKFASASIWAAIREHRGGVLRTPYGVLVADRDLAMKVLENADGDYSVRGYHARMEQSIGSIYLGLDDEGPNGDYETQSNDTNAAIGSITLEAAFNLARAQTVKELGQFIEDAKLQARMREDARWELSLDVRELVDKVLADICEYWFGLSEDGGFFKRGGARWDWTPGMPPLYPGHFTAPSRYIFQPHPGRSVEDFGREYGTALHEKFLEWIRHLRQQNDRPTNPQHGETPVGEVIFGPPGTPSEAEMDQAARTFVGALMGFLPTVDGNLRLILNEWLHDGTFWSLRAALAGNALTGWQDAVSGLIGPLKQAMQLRPSPELVWRTATRPHSIGTSATGKVQVEPDEKVVVSIVSATQQCLAEGRADVSPIFGGDRSKPHRPTHACPGYEAAMGVLLGFVSALIEAKESMRPSVAPLALVLEGACEQSYLRQLAEASRIALLREREYEGQREAFVPDGVGAIGGAHGLQLNTAVRPLLAWGDSWLHYRGDSNIAGYLGSHGYRFPIPTLGDNGIKLQTMSEDPNRKLFIGNLEQMILAQTPPVAIVLSGGGNDCVHKTLGDMLYPANSGHSTELIPAMLDEIIDVKLEGYYARILDDIRATCAKFGKNNIRVLLHAYDYPVPDGRLIAGWPRNPLSWLYPSIHGAGYDDLAVGKRIMRTVIDRFYGMQRRLAQTYAPMVIVVDVPGISDGFADYTKYWENELHPVRAGFDLVGKKFTNILDGL